MDKKFDRICRVCKKAYKYGCFQEAGGKKKRRLKRKRLKRFFQKEMNEDR